MRVRGAAGAAGDIQCAVGSGAACKYAASTSLSEVVPNALRSQLQRAIDASGEPYWSAVQRNLDARPDFAEGTEVAETSTFDVMASEERAV